MADTVKTVIEQGKDTTVYNIAEVMPQFEGGEAQLQKYIAKNISYENVPLLPV